MWSRTSFRSLKYKAKKGVLKKIGMTEDQQEGSDIQAALSSAKQFKTDMRDIHFKVRGLANAGSEYNNTLVYLCGSGLKGEQLFNKEQIFVESLRECLCPVFATILETDIPEIEELILVYKAAKLDYEKVYFQTVKEMKKKEVPGADDLEEVLKYNESVGQTRKTWMESKNEVLNLRDKLKCRLDNEVLKALAEVHDFCDTDRHRLYCEYLKKRILNTSMCMAASYGQLVIPKSDAEDEKIDNKEQVKDSDSDTNEADGKINTRDDNVEKKSPEISKTTVLNSAESPVVEEPLVSDIIATEAISTEAP